MNNPELRSVVTRAERVVKGCSRWLLGILRCSAVASVHKKIYYGAEDTWGSATWLGVRTLKLPIDLWTYQEIISHTRPSIVIETGTYHGGSALYLASLFDLIGSGRVLSIDIKAWVPPPPHPRIQYLRGSSLSPEVFEMVRSAIRSDDRVMVLLDSDHSKAHVLEEMRLYGSLVTDGCYLIVEDTNVNGNPVKPFFGDGPMEAVREFLKEGPGFLVEKHWERWSLTFNPGGFLRRCSK